MDQRKPEVKDAQEGEVPQKEELGKEDMYLTPIPVAENENPYENEQIPEYVEFEHIASVPSRSKIESDVTAESGITKERGGPSSGGKQTAGDPEQSYHSISLTDVNSEDKANSATNRVIEITPQRIVFLLLVALLLLVLGGIIGYHIKSGKDTSKIEELGSPPEAPAASTTPSSATTAPPAATTALSATTAAPPAATSQPVITTPEHKEDSTTKAVQYHNCSDVCLAVIDGTLPNQPIGISVRGAVAKIHPSFAFSDGVNVYCDCNSGADDAWTVFQRRFDGSVSFNRNWDDYEAGFGTLDGEYWLGLELLHNFTDEKPSELRVDLHTWVGQDVFAEYKNFRVGRNNGSYQLQIGQYSGNAGDSLGYRHNLATFSATDVGVFRNCSRAHKGGWWFMNGCYGCYLNGEYGGNSTGMSWYDRRSSYFYAKQSEMKFRQRKAA